MASYKGSILTIVSSSQTKDIDLKHKIGQVIVIGDKVVVRFELVVEDTPDRNILCLDSNGRQVWQVQDPDEWRTGKKFIPRDLFGGVWLNSEGALWGYGRSSDYRIDATTGKILEEAHTK